MKTLYNSESTFDEDYFERGLETGVSCYSHYRWMPELTIPLAHKIAKHLSLSEDDRVLDYGCAKGYLVKAFRLLGFQAFGCDISDYALASAPEDTKRWLFSARTLHTVEERFSWIVAKDVLEHVHYMDLEETLYELRRCASKLFVVVPLGSNGKYVVDAYDLDVTHMIREPLEWWRMQLEAAGFSVTEATYRIPGIKDNWASYSRGNGFLIGE